MYPGKGHQARPLGQGAGGRDFMGSVMSMSLGLCTIVAQNEIVLKYTN